MKLSAKISFWIALVFALFCLAYSLFGFFSMDDITDAQQRADAQGYAWFWLFLAGAGFGMGTLNWFMAKGSFDGGEKE
jgi:NADH:ubiquinone oxidoreductase subunit 5 (subunit L)/multisubunit Na+/H+ antiporter MnhA subunit